MKQHEFCNFIIIPLNKINIRCTLTSLLATPTLKNSHDPSLTNCSTTIQVNWSSIVFLVIPGKFITSLLFWTIGMENESSSTFMGGKQIAGFPMAALVKICYVLTIPPYQSYHNCDCRLENWWSVRIYKKKLSVLAES